MTSSPSLFHFCSFAILVIACLTFAACETPLDMDMERTASLTVVSAMPQADTALCVRLTKSRYFLSRDGIEPITGAQVSLSLNGAPCTPTVDTSGYYHFSDVPQGGDTIALRISTAGQEPIQASTRIPTTPVVQLISIESEYDPSKDTVTRYDDDGYTTISPQDYDVDIRFRIADPKEENYYKVTVGYTACHNQTIYYPQPKRDTIICQNEPLANIKCSDPAIRTLPSVIDMIDEEDGSFFGQTLFFTDQTFAGKNHEMKVSLSIEYYEFQGHDPREIPLVLSVYSLTRDQFLYERTVAANVSSITSLFSEPVQLHFNIKQDGCVGILGGSACTRIEASYYDINGTDNP
ncbi:MAG: DUF4249 domain-containing protein [Bacteroidales bacterium]|nr:DUF4249 domain-containing protein [Bacteroidales bacterium]